MPYLDDYVLDNGLEALRDGDYIHACSAEPATYAEVSTYSLGNKALPVSLPSPVDGATQGRRLIIPAQYGATASATGTVTHFAIVDTGNSRLLMANALESSQPITNGDTFDFAAVELLFEDGVSG